MYFIFGRNSSLLLAFFLHLVVYSILFLVRGKRDSRLSDQLLGFFLILASLFIVPWMTGFGGWYDKQPYRDILFYTPFLQPLFFGPLLYLYIKALTNVTYKVRKQELLHFLPGLLYLTWCLVVFVTDKLILKRYYLMNGRSDPDFDRWYSYAWLCSVVIYLLITLRYYQNYKQFAGVELSFADVAGFRWLRNFLWVFTALTVLFLFEQILSIFIELQYARNWYYFLAFAIICYYMAISAYNTQLVRDLKLTFDPDAITTQQNPVLVDDAVNLVDDTWMLLWKHKLDAAIEEKMFLKADLTLSDLALHLGTNPSLLSKVINGSYGLSFNDFINQHRVKEAVRLMQHPQYMNFSLLAIALEAGFYSKATFNRAFKKFTGVNPSQYLKQ
ncbi:helix-turn-helix transcriptional regulator [Mucilaginibacter pallidiroseus]|uniref:Helix-turn-helix transcriptional regulator n=1 Tax=Mucilaginibacter pallidiroseus TaxID=2599295 RepID=A0A563UHV5_9SPHI|nr:AraC family transcriptional regulator [Mucilaginibacter pallidiroseus]TWR30945.1 helix-turn-helix transcriptional regulator [Mucilaginibacter pallidiroseus]